MSDLFSVLQEALLGSKPSGVATREIKAILSASDLHDRSRSNCIYRACSILDELEAGNIGSTWWDLAGSLRQVILNHQRRIVISTEVSTHLAPILDYFKMGIEGDELDAYPHSPVWMVQGEDINKLYEFKSRRMFSVVSGDGLLYHMTRHITYHSLAQKTAVYMAMNLPPGYTLLACLPTGGGKSLVNQMPAYYRTRGGALDGVIEGAGTTIVVVPTVALAMDQARAARLYFPDAEDGAHRPTAYFSGMPEEERKAVFRGVANGNMPLVYISPEAVLGDGFSAILLEAARAGKLATLVIDEAHIVEDWGSAFRPEFQFLAPFRKRLLEESKGKLRTILLSATFTDETAGLLRELFSEADHFIGVRGDELRPEIMYWLDYSSTEEQRQNKVMELLPLLPRPIILYVTRPEKATDWVDTIESLGFGRIAEFTGRTSSLNRKNILNRWMDDSIDIMVATSAFGMGVDKFDVRCVLHCCMPESVNRFYQEVGRGGRDGFPSLSYYFSVPSVDSDESFGLVKSKVLRAENMANRWDSMLSNCLEFNGDRLLVDTDSKPIHIENEYTGQRNADFNEITLLFLYRKGLIDILEIKPGNIEERRKVRVRMLDIPTLQNRSRLEQILESPRTEEWQFIKNRFNEMKAIGGGDKRSCWANIFMGVYPQVEYTCGGCPPCRRKGRAPEIYTGNLEVNLPHSLQPYYKGDVYGGLKTIMGENREWILRTENLGGLHLDLLSVLVRCGVTNIVFDSTESELLEEFISLNGNFPIRYQVFCLDEASKFCPQVLGGVVVLLYPSVPLQVSKMYEWSQQYLRRAGENRVVHLAPSSLKIESQGKWLCDLSDGGMNCALDLVKAMSVQDY